MRRDRSDSMGKVFLEPLMVQQFTT